MGAQGGRIAHHRDEAGRIADVDCVTREGHIHTGCPVDLFRKLKRRGLIASSGGQPYRITRAGLAAVRAQANNR